MRIMKNYSDIRTIGELIVFWARDAILNQVHSIDQDNNFKFPAV